MKNIKLLISALVLCFATFVATAQNIKVTGVVKDSNGAPVEGVVVMVPGTTNGTSTNARGEYSISVPGNATLLFQCIGYADVTESVGNRSKVDVTLKEDTEALEATVVVGYGTAKKIGSIVGSITTVNAESIKNSPSASVMDNLQGKVAGLQVLTTGGVAGDNNVSMTLHGVGSLGAGSSPLYIIDGVPAASSSSVMNMNPNDILSISILKDASATSIYGSRAANGVVYVTTKTGNFDSKASVTVRSQWGISTLADMTLYNNMMSGDELKEFWIRAGLSTRQNIISTYDDHGYTANTKWHLIAQNFNTPQYQNDVTVEGGSSKVAYMIGGSQFYQQGSTPGNFYERYTLRTNLQAHPANWIKIGASMNLTYDINRTNPNWGNSSGGAGYTSGGLSFLLNPLYPTIDPITGKEYEITYPNGMTTFKYYQSKISDYYYSYGLFGSVYASITPIHGLTLTSRVGTDTVFGREVWNRLPSFFSYKGNGGRDKDWEFRYVNTITNTIEYAFDINRDHAFNFLLGHEGTAYWYDYTRAYAQQGLKDDRLLLIQNGLQEYYAISESQSEYKTLSFFGHADYTLFDRYIFDATFRYDASSRFGKGNRWAPFWAIGGMWKIKKEEFLRPVSWVNDLNFKLSYGTQGNASIGNYNHLALIGTGAQYQEAASLAVTQPANPFLSWEKQGLLTIALTGRLFNRVDFDVEYYHRKTTDMLMSVPYGYYTGFSELYDNVGSLTNQGIDVTLGIDIARGADYFARFSTTFNYNKEKVTQLFQGLNEWEIPNTYVKYIVGQPVMFYCPIYAGVDPENGKQMWYLPGEDRNVPQTDKSKVTYEYKEDALTQVTGIARNAPIYGGFSLSGGWKGISVLADFSYVLGKYLVNNDAYFYFNPNDNLDSNQHRAVTDFWTPDNKNARFPDWSTGQKMQFDSHLLEDASFLRLKSLQVAYSLPQNWLNWTAGVVKNFKITFTGRNLFILTNYTGIDPEVDSNLTYGIPGNSKQFLGGLEITF